MMVTIASCSFPHEAHLVRARLESEGIVAVVADEHTINMQWLYSNALGGVRVKVSEFLVNEAIEILSKDHSLSLVEERGYSNFLCIKCGSEDTEFLIEGKRMAFMVFIFLNFPFWPCKRIIKCNECGAVNDYHRRNE